MLELISMLLTGIFLFFLGLYIRKKEVVSIIHDSHHTKVPENQRKPYTQKTGIACIIMGIGSILTGTVNFIFTMVYGWIIFGLCFVIGLILMIFASIKHTERLF